MQNAECRMQTRQAVNSAFCPLHSAFREAVSVKRICKPNSVLPERSEDHSSATRVAAVVEQPTRKLMTETGGSIASLFGLPPAEQDQIGKRWNRPFPSLPYFVLLRSG